MKGNNTQQKTARKTSNIVAVPREFISAQKSITLSVDFFFINKCLPDDGEQERFLHHNKSLQYAKGTTLLGFCEGGADDVLLQRSVC